MTDPPVDEPTPARPEPVDGAFLESGHVWVSEYPDGTPFLARVDGTGRLQVAFADSARVSGRPLRWVDAADVPPEFGFAVRALSTHLDRRALRDAVDDPTALTLRCVAVHRRHRGYDWARAPPVVGVDVAYPGVDLLPHELERVFERLGIPPVPTLDTEVHVRDLDPDGRTVPETQWGDGTAYGVLYRKKGGGVALSVASQYEGAPPEAEPIGVDVEEYAATVASDEALAALSRTYGSPPSVSTLTDAALDRTLRAEFGRLTHGGTSFDCEALRSALARRVAVFLR